MGKFKAGDVVERKPHHNNDLFLHKVGPGPHVVTAVSTKGHWLCINDWTDSGTDSLPWSSRNFTLAQGQDDPLPPAPDSVLYFNSIRDRCNDQCITVRPDDDPRYEGTLCISIHPRGDYNEYKSVALDPDAALQLAHDLRRMAMEIKRKEKQND